MVEWAVIGGTLSLLKGAADTLKSGSDAYKSLRASGSDNDLQALQEVAAKLADGLYPVSYTHLTLPTIYSV